MIIGKHSPASFTSSDDDSVKCCPTTVVSLASDFLPRDQPRPFASCNELRDNAFHALNREQNSSRVSSTTAPAHNSCPATTSIKKQL
jgi:hypothetical protein